MPQNKEPPTSGISSWVPVIMAALVGGIVGFAILAILFNYSASASWRPLIVPFVILLTAGVAFGRSTWLRALLVFVLLTTPTILVQLFLLSVAENRTGESFRSTLIILSATIACPLLGIMTARVFAQRR